MDKKALIEEGKKAMTSTISWLDIAEGALWNVSRDLIEVVDDEELLNLEECLDTMDNIIQDAQTKINKLRREFIKKLSK